jgi:hypothetical protein
MSSPEENSDVVTSPFNDVHENVRRFNEDEAVWRCFKKKGALRKRLLRLLGPRIHNLRSPKSSSMISTGLQPSAKPGPSGRLGSGSRRETKALLIQYARHALQETNASRHRN